MGLLQCPPCATYCAVLQRQRQRKVVLIAALMLMLMLMLIRVFRICTARWVVAVRETLAQRVFNQPVYCNECGHSCSTWQTFSFSTHCFDCTRSFRDYLHLRVQVRAVNQTSISPRRQLSQKQCSYWTRCSWFGVWTLIQLMRFLLYFITSKWKQANTFTN